MESLFLGRVVKRARIERQPPDEMREKRLRVHGAVGKGSAFVSSFEALLIPSANRQFFHAAEAAAEANLWNRL